jgi:hypothetical protein
MRWQAETSIGLRRFSILRVRSFNLWHVWAEDLLDRLVTR